jgi:hypothetical protein
MRQETDFEQPLCADIRDSSLRGRVPHQGLALCGCQR